MIDFSLVEKDVDVEKYNPSSGLPLLFLGFPIRNEYDNKRIIINPAFKPIDVLHPIITSFNHLKGKAILSLIPLKGIVLSPNDKVKTLIKLIQEQEENSMSLQTYQNILNQFDMTCSETYSFFNLGLYPIDYTNLKNVCTDSFNTDKKIFQRLLSLDEKTFEFQRFSSLKLFILTQVAKKLAS